MKFIKPSIFSSLCSKVLVWKTNFDTTVPFVDSTNTTGNRYASGSDLITNDYPTTTSRVSSGNIQKDKSQITSLREKSRPETSDERRARKVKF
jgi:hypothetical protein